MKTRARKKRILERNEGTKYERKLEQKWKRKKSRKGERTKKIETKN